MHLCVRGAVCCVSQNPGSLGEVSDRDAAPPLWRRVTGSIWFHLISAFVVVGLVLSFVAKPYLVPSASMEQTLSPGDRVLVNRLAYAGSSPQPGDVVVFDADEAWDGVDGDAESPLRGVLRWAGEVTGFGPSGSHTLVKRVIAVAGQRAVCCDAEGRVVVNGEALDEPYVVDDFPFEAGALDCQSTPRSQRCFDEVLVPEDSFLMLGDNRAGSSDSAAQCRDVDASVNCWRWATREGIVGQAVLVFWPIERWGGV